MTASSIKRARGIGAKPEARISRFITSYNFFDFSCSNFEDMGFYIVGFFVEVEKWWWDGGGVIPATSIFRLF